MAKLGLVWSLCASLLLLAACGGANVPLTSAADVAAERGRGLAEVRCGGCHGLGLDGESPRSAAFRDMRRGMTALSFRRRMADIAEGRHYDMPRIKLTANEADDIAAYIESLETP
ncbi:MAG: cytochrome c [Phenylobacterium sp.]|uniref:c-type cytochrome n=1 Tax=Phenylobacterium sp. TaxID=1871053 RepID=UPI0027182114|nr:cytochrome c [Phenylobacterium sp.]MDO8911859.1 cytochrome c [Phenylobacterium sp.]MDP3102273.1 cytochrome c [Phenylobacterium sp.]